METIRPSSLAKRANESEFPSGIPLMPSYSDTFARLGLLINAYLVVPTLFSTLNITWQDDEWNRLVRTQVYRIDDPLLDLDTAYNLMDKQRDKCKYCNADLTLDRRPTIHKDVRHHHFLGMDSTETRFAWYCSGCVPQKSKKMFSESFDDKVLRFVCEEYSEEERDDIEPVD